MRYQGPCLREHARLHALLEAAETWGYPSYVQAKEGYNGLFTLRHYYKQLDTCIQMDSMPFTATTLLA